MAFSGKSSQMPVGSCGASHQSRRTYRHGCTSSDETMIRVPLVTSKWSSQITRCDQPSSSAVTKEHHTTSWKAMPPLGAIMLEGLRANTPPSGNGEGAASSG